MNSSKESRIIDHNTLWTDLLFRSSPSSVPGMVLFFVFLLPDEDQAKKSLVRAMEHFY